MALISTEAEWHDISVDPYDLPGEKESVLVTIETLDGERKVWPETYYKNSETGDDILWCTMAVNDYGIPEETMVWYPVVAWAYYPEAYYA